MKQLRPFVDWNVDLRKPLSPSDKRRITIYHKQLEDMRKRPHKVYRPRTKESAKAAREFAGNALPGFNAIPIPVADPKTAKVKFRKGLGIKTQSAGGSQTFIPFGDPIRLAKEPKEYIESLIKRHPQKYFKISIGKSETLGTFARGKIGKEIERIMGNYTTLKDYLRGLYAINIGPQGSIEKYLLSKAEAKTKAKKEAQARARKNGKAKKNNRR